jgi:hypothetical protein
MLINFKLIKSNRNEWVGWFGQDLIKVRVNTEEDANLVDKFIEFLEQDLGIEKTSIVLKSNYQNKIQLELPDQAWELFLTVVK